MLPERAGSHSSADHPIHPQLQNPAFHPIQNRHTASASPPMIPRNLPAQFPMGPRVSTPQPPMTRPASRNQRRSSSGLAPPNSYPVSQPQQSNGMYSSYHMPHPSQYNPPQPMTMQPTMQYPAYPSQQPTSQPPPPPQTQPTTDANMPDYRRQSMPPTYSNSISQNERPERPQQPTLMTQGIQKQTQSRSIFTPIGPSDSMLAAHFSTFGDNSRSRSIDVGAMQRKKEADIKMEKPAPPAPPQPIDTTVNIQPPTRQNSMTDPKSAGMRPRLKVQIPEESPVQTTASPHSALPGNRSAHPGNENAIVLPPPSPSVGALLSAGPQGPANPFSRPLPVNAPEQTPMSALPSRFTQDLLGSPSTFFGSPDWLFSKVNDNNMLPSPLNFQTPNGNPPHFFRDPPEVNGNGKRRSPEGDIVNGVKRIKS